MLKNIIKYKEIIFIIFLLLISVYLRFYQLGYSDFYGDETKVLYLRKDTSASDFFFNQRKGPTQFFVAWFTEKLTGGYDEFSTRVPFALAGILSVFAFYYLVRRMFGFRAAAFSSLLFSLSGYFIAFSKTVQYQSFLWLFGLISVIFFYEYYLNLQDQDLGLLKIKKLSSKFKLHKKHKSWLYLLLSGVFLALAYLSHWDAIFYEFALFAIFIALIVQKKLNKKELINVLVFMVLPAVLILAAYYIPYFLHGSFLTGSEYIKERVTGESLRKHSSIYTTWIYNPTVLYFMFLGFSLVGILKLNVKKLHKSSSKLKYLFEFDNFNITFLLLWAALPFILFEIVFKNPGTHIQNYILPLTMLSGVGIVYTLDYLDTKKRHMIHEAFLVFICISFFVLFLVMNAVYVPTFSRGFPFKDAPYSFFALNRINKDDYQLFLYGFPYNRGWRELRQYFLDKDDMPHDFYTNDNITIGQYYFHGVIVTSPGIVRTPKYFMDIEDNQEIRSYETQKKLDTVFDKSHVYEKVLSKPNTYSLYKLTSERGYDNPY